MGFDKLWNQDDVIFNAYHITVAKTPNSRIIPNNSLTISSIMDRLFQNVCGLFRSLSVHVIQTEATSLIYRIRTSCKAFYHLYTANPQELETFFTSYDVLWDRDVASTEADFEVGLPHKKFWSDPAESTSIVDWYSILNHLCALGNVEKMYIPPIMDEQMGVFDNQLLYEQWFCDHLKVDKNSHLLELGCGRGRISHHIATKTGAKITAMNIDEDQLQAARQFATNQGLNGTQITFVQGNFNYPLPFPDDHFDAVYQVQAMTYSWDLDQLFSEIARVLKPGGMFSGLDCVMLDGYDPKNETHRSLLHGTRQVIGLAGFWHYTYWIGALEKNEFNVQIAETLGGPQWPLINKERWLFESVANVVDWLCSWHILRKHFGRLMRRFCTHGQSFTIMDKEGMLTANYALIAQLKDNIKQ